MAIKTQREMLEAALAANFDDLAAHAAYADLLMEEDDPRGEYIQLHLTLENHNQSPIYLRECRERVRSLQLAHERDWLGPLAPFLLGRNRATVDPVAPNIEFTFRRGWLSELHVQDVRDAFTKVLADAPEARLLQVLELTNTNVPNNRGPLDPLLASPNLRCLKRFVLGDQEAVQPTADGRYAVGMVRQMPQLRELELRASQVDVRELFGLPLPELRFLHVDYLPSEPLDILATNRTLTNLVKLHLSNQTGWQTAEESARPEPSLELDGFSPMKLRYLLEAKQFQNLNELTLRIGTLGDIGCEELARSGVLKRLRRLDLRHCNLTDTGAQTLARCRDIGHLEFLDVGGNRLTLVGVEALREAELQIRWDSQWGEYLAPDDDIGDLIV